MISWHQETKLIFLMHVGLAYSWDKSKVSNPMHRIINHNDCLERKKIVMNFQSQQLVYGVICISQWVERKSLMLCGCIKANNLSNCFSKFDPKIVIARKENAAGVWFARPSCNFLENLFDVSACRHPSQFFIYISFFSIILDFCL